jgi:hypothetical protein
MGCFVSRRDLRNLVVLAAICVGACGSPPPSAVDDEFLLVDLAACARGDAICERSGSVGPTELLVDGNQGVALWAKLECGPQTCDADKQECCAASPTECVEKGKCGGGATIAPTPARISLPIRRHADNARLAWIAIGMASGETVRTLRVTIDGKDETVVEPSPWFARVEVSGRDRQPAVGARLELTATRGIFGIAWIVGRWKR